MDFMGYKNKRVIVSGCFSGMGEATARLLLELGAQVHALGFYAALGFVPVGEDYVDAGILHRDMVLTF